MTELRIPLAPLNDLPPESAGSLLGRIVAHAPTAAAAFRGLAETVFAKLQLDPLERELAVLLTLRLEAADYPWDQHVHIGKELGVSDDQISAIAVFDLSASAFNARQRALLAFVRQAVVDVRVDDETFRAAAQHFPSREIVECLFAIGVYMTVARICEISGIPSEPPHGLDSLRAAEAKAEAERALAVG